MKRITLALISFGFLIGSASGQDLETQIRSTLDDYSRARLQLDPSHWSNDQRFFWATKFLALSQSLTESVPFGTRDEVRSNALSLLIPIQDYASARAVVQAGMADQTNCEGRLKWGNFALGVEKAESQLARRRPRAEVVLPITRLALQGCDDLLTLQHHPGAFAYAVVLHHAAAYCDDDLARRAAKLLELERTVGSVAGGKDLISDRFALLVDAASALCAAGRPEAALEACARAELDEGRTRDHAVTAVARDASIALDRRVTFVEASIASRSLGVSDVNRMAGLVNELARKSKKESALAAIALIDRILQADAGVLRQINDQHVAHRLETEGQPPRTQAETRAFESSMLTMKWFLHRAVLRDRKATIQDAADLLARFPDHQLRQDIERSMR
jgi:hypothetical protein